MSHFTMAIFTENINPENIAKIMEPYNEGQETENPNAKWDWYLVGGRWTGLLLLKEKGKGTSGEPGLFKEVNTDPMRADIALLKDVDLEATYKEREDNNKILTYGFIKIDGSWIAKGEMGWFGSSSENNDSINEYKKEWNEYIQTLDMEKTFIVILDCHI